VLIIQSVRQVRNCRENVQGTGKHYTECFTTLGHNCRRWFPSSLWWKKFI